MTKWNDTVVMLLTCIYVVLVHISGGNDFFSDHPFVVRILLLLKNLN